MAKVLGVETVDVLNVSPPAKVLGVAHTYFTSKWKTDNAGTSNADQITLPLVATGSYDFMVAWGDGSSDTITAYNAAAVTHTFPSAGTYTVRITGTCTGWRFNNGGDKLKITEISAWGPLRLGNTDGYFYGCANLTIPATDTLDMTGTTTLKNAFNGCPSITTFPSLATLDTSNVDSMYAMFYACTNLNQSVSNFDTSSVTTMRSMFNACHTFNQSVSNFDTSLVTSMVNMFQNALNFNQDISGFSIDALTDATEMLLGTAFSQTNYDLLLVAWAAQHPDINDSVAFHAGTAKYAAGSAAARAVLADAVPGGHAWTITDGGAA